MLRENTYCKLGDVLDSQPFEADRLYYNNRLLTRSEMQALNNKRDRKRLVHIDLIDVAEYTFENMITDVCFDHYISDTWIPRYKKESK